MIMSDSEEEMPEELLLLEDEGSVQPESLSDEIKADPVPVTVLCGFLGAGKTTLLGHLLRERHGKRICVIQNEFGKRIGIEEEELVMSRAQAGHDAADVRSDLVSALERIVEMSRAQHAAEGPFDLVVVECDGLARPGPVIESLWVDEELGSALRLDGVICVVDASNIEHQLKGRHKAALNDQLRFSDRIVLNKTDLLHSDPVQRDTAVARTRNVVKEVNPTAEIEECSFGRVRDIGWVLQVAAYGDERALCDVSKMEHHLHDHFSPSSGDGDAHCGAGAVYVAVDGALEVEAFERWIGAMLWDENGGKGTRKKRRRATIGVRLDAEASGHFEEDVVENSDEYWEVIRMKGLVSVRGDNFKWALQGVYDLFEVRRTQVKWDACESRATKLVFVGHGLDESEFQVGLQTLIK